MLAALSNQNSHDFEIKEAQIDDPRAGEVLVRIHGVGICHTDIATVEQRLPFPLPAVLGHEGAGIVEKIGAGVTKVKVGDHVVLSFMSCGECHPCGAGFPSYCTQFGPLNLAGVRSDGTSALHVHGTAVSSFFFGQSSFAELALARERNVIKIDTDVPLELMGVLGCGIQTGAGAVMRALCATAGSSILVIGGGTVGLSAVMGAKLQGCSTIIVSEPHAGRRDLARTLGATHCIDPLNDDLATMVHATVPGGVQYALDSTARPQTIAAGIECLAVRGTIGLVGLPADPAMMLQTSMFGMLGRGIAIRWISEGDSDPDVFIPELVAHYKAGRFPLDLLCRTYPLADINLAVADQLAGRCVKPILVPREAGR